MSEEVIAGAVEPLAGSGGEEAIILTESLSTLSDRNARSKGNYLHERTDALNAQLDPSAIVACFISLSNMWHVEDVPLVSSAQ